MSGVGRPRKRRGRRPAIAERLRAAREARGMTQQDAADELGISQGTLGKYESGTQRPRLLVRRYLECWASASLGESYEVIPGIFHWHPAPPVGWAGSCSIYLRAQ